MFGLEVQVVSEKKYMAHKTHAYFRHNECGKKVCEKGEYVEDHVWVGLRFWNQNSKSAAIPLNEHKGFGSWVVANIRKD